jgi:hypothetical protein
MVAVFAAVSFTALVAAAALSLDGGALMTERRHAQETADAAALAAAADLFQHWPLVGHAGTDPNGTAAQSAQTTAAANGYGSTGTSGTSGPPGLGAVAGTDTGGGAAGTGGGTTGTGTNSTVTVNIPPQSGNFVGQVGYAEVIVTYNLPATLSSLFGRTSNPVSARAVARGLWVPANPQIIAFDLSSPGALLVTNNLGSISVRNGPVVVNSSSGSAASNTTSATFSAPSFQITGGTFGNFTGPVAYGTRPSPDPLFYLPPPTADLSGQPLPTQPGPAVYNESNPPPNPLPPGIYPGGVQVTQNDVSQPGASLTLQSNGIYVMQGGGFFFNSTGNLTGNGVLIYNQPPAVDDGSGIIIRNPRNTSTDAPGTISLSPLTNGPYQGITLFQQQSAIGPIVLFGGGGMTVTGTIYAANGSVSVRTESYNGNNDTGGTQFMGRRLLFSGLSDYTLTQLPQPSRQRIIGLVE